MYLCAHMCVCVHAHIHTHTPFSAPFPGLDSPGRVTGRLDRQEEL